MAAACAATVATVAAVGPAAAATAGVFGGDLQDLAPAVVGPFDGASARLALVDHHDASTAVLVVKDVDPSVAGRTFGAHLHSGPCVAGNPAAAGPHYNHSGVVPPVVSDRTEVWLDFTVTKAGAATSVAHVPWAPDPGERSVVVHELPTAPNGTAGARLACLPVAW
jgi:hypothetical protein